MTAGGYRSGDGCGAAPVLVVLTGRRVRHRAPSAVQWRLIEYDPTTLLPVADLGCQWEPASMAAINGLNRVSDWVLAWVTELTGPAATVGGPADPIAGPGSWYITAGPVTAGPVTAGPVTAGPVTAGPVTAGPVTAGPAWQAG